MGFEITGISYDPSRQLQATQKNRFRTDDTNRINLQFIGVPYIIDFNLYIVGKNQDDNLQIYESIVPFFTPDFVVATNLIPEMGIKLDVPIELTGTEFEDSYDADISERRTLTWTLSFRMKVLFYGPISKQGPIKKVIMNFKVATGSGPITEDDLLTPTNARITTTPGLTANGTPTTVETESIPYLQIDADDDFGFVQKYEEFDP